MKRKVTSRLTPSIKKKKGYYFDGPIDEEEEEEEEEEGAKSKHQVRFPKDCSLLNLLCEIIIELTFEK